jgi:hypothetical protein
VKVRLFHGFTFHLHLRAFTSRRAFTRCRAFTHGSASRASALIANRSISPLPARVPRREHLRRQGAVVEPAAAVHHCAGEEGEDSLVAQRHGRICRHSSSPCADRGMTDRGEEGRSSAARTSNSCPRTARAFIFLEEDGEGVEIRMPPGRSSSSMGPHRFPCSSPLPRHLRSTARATPPSPTADPAQRAGWERGGAELRGKLSCAPKHNSSPPPLRRGRRRRPCPRSTHARSHSPPATSNSSCLHPRLSSSLRPRYPSRPPRCPPPLRRGRRGRPCPRSTHARIRLKRPHVIHLTSPAMPAVLPSPSTALRRSPYHRHQRRPQVPSPSLPTTR